MDPQFLINAAFTLAGMLGGFLMKATWSEIKGLQAALADLQKSIQTTYLRRDEFRDHAERIERALERIEAKLDTKQDRVAYVLPGPQEKHL